MASEHQKIWRNILKIIAHRGNTLGPSINENKLWYLKEAIAKGFEVEVDVWVVDGLIFFGHDGPQYAVTESDLISLSDKAWFHCKNIEALNLFCNRHSMLKFFWHEQDRYTLTSNGYIWSYPGQAVGGNCIIVDLDSGKDYECYAVCTDYC